MVKAKKRKRKTLIGRKPKQNKKCSLIQEDILTNETICESQSLRTQDQSFVKENFLSDETYINSGSKINKATKRKRKVNIGRKYKKGSQLSASSNNKIDSDLNISNITETLSKCDNNTSKSKYTKYNKSTKGKVRLKNYLSTNKGKISQKKNI